MVLAFQRVFADILEIEQAAEQALRQRRDQDFVWTRQLLQRGGEIRRLTDEGKLAAWPFADEVAHDDKTGRDPDTDLDPLAACRLRGDRGDDLERGAHRTLGVVLVGQRKPKYARIPSPM